MTNRRWTELHWNLSANVAEIADYRAELLAAAAEAETLLHQAIAVAAAHGVPQRNLAALVEVSPPRVSQIVSVTDLPPSDEGLRDRINKIVEWPQEHLQEHSPHRLRSREERDRRFQLIKTGNAEA